MADKDNGSLATRPMGPPKTTSSFDADDVRALQENRSTMPKLDRTMSDIYQDELYNPIVPLPARPVPDPINRKPQSKKGDSLSQLLQAANEGHLEARSQTARQDNIRTRSPFSPWASERFPSNDGTSKSNFKRPGLTSPHGVVVLNTTTTPQGTVSPKEVALNNVNGETQSSLFPDSPSSPTNNDTTEGTSVSSDESTSDLTQTDSRDRMGKRPVAKSLQTAQKHLVKAGDNQSWLKNLHDISTDQIPSASAAISSQTSDNLPDFPAHLTSMDTTKSESLANSSQDTQETTPEIQHNPKTPRTNGGTYTCTYSGCTKRFDTGAKLQKHKREDHRQVVRPLDHESDQEAAIERNNQSGPHRCDRINPSTGKPCNSVFSRPYDLTRHEDTIHNARKQKVRCQLCTEEKTFSRNDALTRHMRVVHPNVDFSAKNKKRQGP